MTPRVTIRTSWRLAALLLASTVAPLHAQSPATAAEQKRKLFEGSASVGFSQTSGNANVTTTNLANKLKYSVKGWAVSQDLTFFYGEANDRVNANFWNGGFRGQRRLTSRVGAFMATRFDRNALQGISTRFEEGIGVDVKAVDALNDKLNFAFGGSMFQQQLTPGTTAVGFKRSFPAARAAADYRHRFSELAFLQQSAEYLPSLSDSSSYLVNSETTLVAPLHKSLGVKVGYVIRYNSAPPVRNNVVLKSTDTYFSSGLTYSF